MGNTIQAIKDLGDKARRYIFFANVLMAVETLSWIFADTYPYVHIYHINKVNILLKSYKSFSYYQLHLMFHFWFYLLLYVLSLINWAIGFVSFFKGLNIGFIHQYPFFLSYLFSLLLPAFLISSFFTNLRASVDSVHCVYGFLFCSLFYVS